MNDSSHNFVSFDPDDCPRCINCDVRSGSRHAEPVCPVVFDNVPCAHPGIDRAEGNYFWCSPCHRWIGNNGYTKPVVYFPKSPHREAVELRHDADSGRYL